MNVKRGFTLLELLLVIAAIGILAAIVIVAINPQRQLAQTRDATRQSEVNAVWKALQQYEIDHQSLPQPILDMTEGSEAEICDGETSEVDCTNAGFLYLTDALVPTYIPTIPKDPGATGNGSGYTISISSVNGKIVITAPLVEQSSEIVIGAPLPEVEYLEASGGTESTINDGGTEYRVHTFTSSENFDVSIGGTVEYLIVAGGGGGGRADTSARSGGGGGAGGVVTGTIEVTPQTYAISVGTGGDGTTGHGGLGGEVGDMRSGEDSTFAGLTAIGGGGGGNGGAGDGADGGSGGGSGRNEDSRAGDGTPGQGNNGAFGWPGGTNPASGGGGGGGASSPGINATATTGGDGGDGISSSIIGTSTFYGGGGGGARSDGNPGNGGQGGGGNGADVNTNQGEAGVDGTGGGGGGGVEGDGGNGGSGIVIIRYPIGN